MSVLLCPSIVHKDCLILLFLAYSATRTCALVLIRDSDKLILLGNVYSWPLISFDGTFCVAALYLISSGWANYITEWINETSTELMMTIMELENPVTNSGVGRPVTGEIYLIPVGGVHIIFICIHNNTACCFQPAGCDYTFLCPPGRQLLPCKPESRPAQPRIPWGRGPPRRRPRVLFLWELHSQSLGTRRMTLGSNTSSRRAPINLTICPFWCTFWCYYTTLYIIVLHNTTLENWFSALSGWIRYHNYTHGCIINFFRSKRYIIVWDPHDYYVCGRCRCWGDDSFTYLNHKDGGKSVWPGCQYVHWGYPSQSHWSGVLISDARSSALPNVDCRRRRGRCCLFSSSYIQIYIRVAPYQLSDDGLLVKSDT